MRLGAPVFIDTDDPEELALAHRRLGYRAAFCPEANLEDTARLRAIEDAFARHDVVIAEVGVWNDLLASDPAKRAQNLKAMVEGLALADEVGALCVVNIAGGRNPERWDGPHPDNFSRDTFEEIVENARHIIDEARPRRAKLTYEMMPNMIPDGPDSYRELISAVDRPAFGVHLDVVNIVNSPRGYYDTTALINACFDELGPEIVSCHLKDIRLDNRLTVHLDEVMPGEGGFDIPTYLRRIAALPQDPPVLLEHLQTAEEFDRARGYVVEAARGAGISLT